MVSEVNMVNAPIIARERGIRVTEVKRDAEGVYESYIRFTVTTERQTRSVAGTVFSDGNPRIIQVKNIDMEASLSPHMLYVINEDKPGFIGTLGTALGEAKVNIATFNLGRSGPGEEAIALVAVDEAIDAATLAKVRALPNVKQAKALSF
jgi:D-3-phosphoglycerate dehydrogenase